jgi:glyoxylase-like metal-dependent hydrolase (beta-lactamase superfamily II)
VDRYHDRERGGVTGRAPDHTVIAARYAERETTLSAVYYGWPVYDEPDEPIRMTYYFWIVQPPDGSPVIVDTGFDPAFAAGLGRRAICPPADLLARLGVDAAGVKQVVVTHLHYDHIGNLAQFPNAQFLVSRRELEFWTSKTARRQHFAHHTDPVAVAWLAEAAEAGRVRYADDEVTVVQQGIVATLVGGHSPGQLVVSISTAGGGVLLASDAVHYYDELAKDRPFAVVADLADAYRAFDTVRALSAGGRDFVPAHDPLVMQRYPPVEGVEAGLAVRIA